MVQRFGIGLVVLGLITVLATVVTLVSQASGSATSALAGVAAAAGGAELVIGMLLLERANSTARAAYQPLA